MVHSVTFQNHFGRFFLKPSLTSVVLNRKYSVLLGPPFVHFNPHPMIQVEEHDGYWMFTMGESWLKWIPNSLKAEEEKALFESFLPHGAENLPWQQESIFLFGRWHQSPRLTLWLGDHGYAYSGIWHPPAPFPKAIENLKAKAEAWSCAPFNSVLLNCYRDGRDGMGWHADNEKPLGKNPMIASISLGASRTFHIKHRKDSSLKLSFSLVSGSCLVMGGNLQEDWVHAIPKTGKKVGARINLTFRYLYE